MTDVGPYSTAKPLFGTLPGWVADTFEQQRLASYALYEAIYWCVPETFKLTSRGAEDMPIYIPSGKAIVETINRYTAPKLSVIADPAFGTSSDQLLAMQVWTDLARRERFYSKFAANKRYGIIRGDWAFHFYADPTRGPGNMISIYATDPGSLFPVYNPLNIDEIIGWDIVEQYTDSEGKLRIKKTAYRKTTMMGGPSPITVEVNGYEVDAWGGPGMKEEDAKITEGFMPLTTLPAPIDQLPVYLIPNFETPGDIFGSSEMRGIERLMAAVNQSISDEELALALEGLGQYWTDAGTPVDPETGEDVPWNLGPGRVTEVPLGGKFARLNGVGSVTPSQDHLAYLHSQLDAAKGMSAVAKGNVDVSVAESGIALMLELGPILGNAEEKELSITDRLTNMFFDLAKWYVAYEGSQFNSLMEITRWIPKYGEKIPPNKSKDVVEIMGLVAAGVISMDYARTKLRLMGYDDMPDNVAMEAQILTEKTARAAIQQDAFGTRTDGEVNNALNDTGGGTGTGTDGSTGG
jgi:hypothetical protein